MGESHGTRASPRLAYSRRFSHAVRRRRGHSVPHMRRGRRVLSGPSPALRLVSIGRGPHSDLSESPALKSTILNSACARQCRRPAPRAGPGRAPYCSAVVARRKERTSTNKNGSSFVFHRWTTRLRSLSHPATSRSGEGCEIRTNSDGWRGVCMVAKSVVAVSEVVVLVGSRWFQVGKLVCMCEAVL